MNLESTQKIKIDNDDIENSQSVKVHKVKRLNLYAWLNKLIRPANRSFSTCIL